MSGPPSVSVSCLPVIVLKYKKFTGGEISAQRKSEGMHLININESGDKRQHNLSHKPRLKC